MSLLAVDLGLRCGLAHFGGDGQLRWYRSTNFGSRARLKRAVPGVLASIDGLDVVYAEGDANLGAIWARAAERLGARFESLPAETWRARLLHRREQRSGALAKESADHLARQVIAASPLPGATSLRHDAAEAILIGLYGVLEEGLLQSDLNPLSGR